MHFLNVKNDRRSASKYHGRILEREYLAAAEHDVERHRSRLERGNSLFQFEAFIYSNSFRIPPAGSPILSGALLVRSDRYIARYQELSVEEGSPEHRLGQIVLATQEIKSQTNSGISETVRLDRAKGRAMASFT